VAGGGVRAVRARGDALGSSVRLRALGGGDARLDLGVGGGVRLGLVVGRRLVDVRRGDVRGVGGVCLGRGVRLGDIVRVGLGGVVGMVVRNARRVGDGLGVALGRIAILVTTGSSNDRGDGGEGEEDGLSEGHHFE